MTDWGRQGRGDHGWFDYTLAVKWRRLGAQNPPLAPTSVLCHPHLISFCKNTLRLLSKCSWRGHKYLPQWSGVIAFAWLPFCYIGSLRHYWFGQMFQPNNSSPVARSAAFFFFNWLLKKFQMDISFVVPQSLIMMKEQSWENCKFASKSSFTIILELYFKIQCVILCVCFVRLLNV